MRIRPLLPAVLIVSLALLPSAFAEDKKKDKMSDAQKQQQLLQQWKLEQMKKAQQAQMNAAPKKAATPKPAPKAAAPANTPVRLVVTNRSAAPVAVFWIASDGTATPFGSIKPGGQFAQDTFAGHSWQFRAGQKVIKSYAANAQPVQQFTVGSDAAKPPINPPPKPDRGNVVAGQPTPRKVELKVAADTPGNPDASDSDTKIADFLRVHNQARAAVGVGPLKWSAKLAQTAQAWAEQLEATGQFAHNPATTYGENIAGQSPPFTPAGGAKMWLEEKKDYQPGQPGGGNAGHYTQMVWRQTTHVGYGVAKVKGMTVIVANYEPAGNMNNEPPY